MVVSIEVPPDAWPSPPGSALSGISLVMVSGDEGSDTSAIVSGVLLTAVSVMVETAL